MKQRQSKKLMGAILLIVSTQLSFGQTNLLVREPKAIAVITRALTALGGSEKAAQIKSIIVIGSVQSVQNSVAPANFEWKYLINGKNVEFKSKTTDALGSTVIFSGHGKPEAFDHTKGISLPASANLANLPFFLPSAVLSWAIGYTNCEITSDQRKIGDGTGSTTVHLRQKSKFDTHSDDTSQDWSFDDLTGLPIRVEYKVEVVTDSPLRENAPLISVGMEFSDFRQTGSILLPVTLRTYTSGKPTSIFHLDSISFNSSLDEREFDGK